MADIRRNCQPMCLTGVATTPRTGGSENKWNDYRQVAMNLLKGSTQPQSPSAVNTTFVMNSSILNRIYIFRLSPYSSSTAAPTPINRPSSPSQHTVSSSRLPSIPHHTSHPPRIHTIHNVQITRIPHGRPYGASCSSKPHARSALSFVAESWKKCGRKRFRRFLLRLRGTPVETVQSRLCRSAARRKISTRW
jgi:hypothetical protein